MVKRFIYRTANADGGGGEPVDAFKALSDNVSCN